MRDRFNVKREVDEKAIHDSYRQALRRNDYQQQNHFLDQLSFEWCENEDNFYKALLGYQRIVKYDQYDPRSEEEYEKEKKEIKAHWNILASAAMQNSNALDIALDHWPHRGMIQQAICQIEQAAETDRKTVNYKPEYTQYNFDIAKVRLIVASESPKMVGNKPFQYSKADKQLMERYWQRQVNKTQSFAEILRVYNTLKDEAFIVQRRHRDFDDIRYGFGFFTKPYPNTQRKFIEALQQRASQIIGEYYREHQHYANLSEEIEGLLQSELFASKHFQHGVSVKVGKELQRISTDINRVALNP